MQSHTTAALFSSAEYIGAAHAVHPPSLPLRPTPREDRRRALARSAWCFFRCRTASPFTILPQMLFLTSTKRYFGFGDKDDRVVLYGGRVIGRIFLSPQAPAARNWMWTITVMDYPRTIHSRGYSATREQAMADLRSSGWRSRPNPFGGRTKAETPLFSAPHQIGTLCWRYRSFDR